MSAVLQPSADPPPADRRPASDPGVQRWLRSLGPMRRLVGEEAIRVGELARAGDPDAQRRMLAAVGPAVARAAYAARARNEENDLEDYCQTIAAELLDSAIPKWDPALSAWHSYARWWIQASSMRSTVNDRQVRLPQKLYYDGLRERGEALDAAYRLVQTVSFDAPLADDGWMGERAVSLYDRMGSEADRPDVRALQHDRADLVARVLRPPTYTARQAWIWWRLTREEATLKEVGLELGVTRERIRQIRDDVTERLAHTRLRSPRRTRTCHGWPYPCDHDPVTRSGHCTRCWRRIRKAAGVADQVQGGSDAA